ncbi:hypothetical protein ACLB2K_052798 [Fragaria x ananassa]
MWSWWTRWAKGPSLFFFLSFFSFLSLPPVFLPLPDPFLPGFCPSPTAAVRSPQTTSPVLIDRSPSQLQFKTGASLSSAAVRVPFSRTPSSGRLSRRALAQKKVLLPCFNPSKGLALSRARNVVEEVERKILPNFGEHRRSPELFAGLRCRQSCSRENVFGGEKCEEFNGISFRIFRGVLDRSLMEYVLKYSLTDLSNCRLDSDEDIALMMEIFEVLNSRFINIQIFDVGSNSSTSIVPSTVVMSVTVKPAIVSIKAPFDDVDASSDNSNCEFFTGGAVEFWDKLCKYAIENGFQFHYTKNDKSRISAECAKKKRDSCQWYMHSSLRQSNNFFYITKLNNEHTCVCVVRHQKHKRLGSNVVSTIISDKVRANPLMKTRDIMDYLKQDFGFEVAYHTTYRGKAL